MKWSLPLRPPEFAARKHPGRRKDISEVDEEILDCLDVIEQRAEWACTWAAIAFNVAVLAAAGLLLTNGYRLLNLLPKQGQHSEPLATYHFQGK